MPTSMWSSSPYTMDGRNDRLSVLGIAERYAMPINENTSTSSNIARYDYQLIRSIASRGALRISYVFFACTEMMFEGCFWPPLDGHICNSLKLPLKRGIIQKIQGTWFVTNPPSGSGKSDRAHIRSDFRYIRIIGRIIPPTRTKETTAEYRICCIE
jgi:hypothetical protein